jgi:hypothetical protein
MKMIKVTFLVSMFAALSGCMVVPVNPGPHRYYAPAYVAPSIGFGIYSRGGDYGGDHDRGYHRGDRGDHGDRGDRGYGRH